ncbi:hypothetical protein CC78DRAFT_534884 [Lojkania enalia]|uniref:Uncharacterized protein n=1 Tax=Lojkania enalia TaxID=147567 RepID=A0A9P4MYD8_9PLEO|nr:hypothetical protein CC78DRAFT_534884 [Didymosphaeria enalia]
MDSPKQNEASTTSSTSSQASSTHFSLPPSSYLTVPSTRPTGNNLSLPGPTTFDQEDFVLLSPPSQRRSPSNPIPQILEPSRIEISSPILPSSAESFAQYPDPIFMSSVYSSASAESESSGYSNPPARIYRVPSFQIMPSSKKISSVCFH